ncbi:hypothetical protein HDU84_006949 [Entophlyctis sp. JEL0112]|nr:hypothetical protein HDU84_006949 [Entophlyctis sp. JEL0112]
MAATLATAPRPPLNDFDARQLLLHADALARRACEQRMCHLAAVASHVTWHMALKASVLLPYCTEMSFTPRYASGTLSARVARPDARRSSTLRFAPYQHPRANSTLDKISPPHSPNGFNSASAPASESSKIPIVAVMAAFGLQSSNHKNYQPCPGNNQSVQLQKIQTIAFTALSTFNLPSHTIILALFFVHRLLMSSFGSCLKRQKFAGLSDSNFNNGSVVFSRHPVYLFLAGLILADAVLCDAPVPVASWTWVLKLTEVEAIGKHVIDCAFVCKMKGWALSVLGFDVHVDLKVYSKWIESVEGLLIKSGQTQRIMFQRYLEAFSLVHLSSLVIP